MSPVAIAGATMLVPCHDDVIKWKHFPRYWPFVRGIHRWPVNSPHKGQWCEALVFPLICAWTNSWADDGDASELRRRRAHYEVNVMSYGQVSLKYLKTEHPYTTFKWHWHESKIGHQDSHASNGPQGEMPYSNITNLQCLASIPQTPYCPRHLGEYGNWK